MEKDKHKTRVIFRMVPGPGGKECLALFPDIDEGNGLVSSYLHIGQHGGADYGFCINKSRPATKKEYHDLKIELEELGYNLEIRQKVILWSHGRNRK